MNLSGKFTNPGELRTPIALESPSIITDAGGAQSVAYTNAGAAWAKWVNAHGPEALQDGALVGLARATLTIRYHPNLTISWAISKGGQRYQILSMDDIQERHEYLQLQVQALEASA